MEEKHLVVFLNPELLNSSEARENMPLTSTDRYGTKPWFKEVLLSELTLHVFWTSSSPNEFLASVAALKNLSYPRLVRILFRTVFY